MPAISSDSSGEWEAEAVGGFEYAEAGDRAGGPATVCVCAYVFVFVAYGVAYVVVRGLVFVLVRAAGGITQLIAGKMGARFMVKARPCGGG
ncbi:hypothetical protein HK100_010345, partial [Physocladia obscura]